MADDGRLVVRVTRTANATVTAAVILLTGLAALAMGLSLHGLDPTVHLRCERPAQTCTANGAAMTGHWSWNLPFSEWKDSRVEHGTWTVTKGDGHPFVIASGGYDPAKPAALQQFLDDPSATAFTAEYPGVGGPPWWALALMGGLLTLWGVHGLDGQSAELTVDRDAGTLKIARRPPLWPHQSTFPLTAIEGAHLGRLRGRQILHQHTLRIDTTDGRVAFRTHTVAKTATDPFPDEYLAIAAALNAHAPRPTS